MGKHTIDALATVTLEVDAADERAAMERMRELRADAANPFIRLSDGVELYEFAIGDNPALKVAEYVHGEDGESGTGEYDIPRDPADKPALPVVRSGGLIDRLGPDLAERALRALCELRNGADEKELSRPQVAAVARAMELWSADFFG